MTSTRITGGSGFRARRIAFAALAAIAAVVGVVALSGFHTQLREIDPSGPDAASEVASTEIIGIRTFTAPAGLDVQEDLEYGTREDGTLLTLDVCSPAPDPLFSARPAVVSIHGGSWARGDKANADWRNVCLWLASEGFVAASVNYRLVPDARFPAAIDDVALAVEWLRAPEQVERLRHRPHPHRRLRRVGGRQPRLAARHVGRRPARRGRAGRGRRGALGTGRARRGRARGRRRLAAGCAPSSATTSDCDPGAGVDACPQSADASPANRVDPSDPPFFIGHSEQEVVPVGQSQRFAATLGAAGVPVELAIVPGAEHSIGILDEALRLRVAAFLHAYLG